MHSTSIHTDEASLVLSVGEKSYGSLPNFESCFVGTHCTVEIPLCSFHDLFELAAPGTYSLVTDCTLSAQTIQNAAVFWSKPETGGDR